MDATQTLGQVIRSRRLSLGLTQEELAERIGDGVRQAEVSRLECDRVGLPRRRRLERIAAALNLPMGDLLAMAGWSGAERAFEAVVESAGPTSTLSVDVAAGENDWTRQHTPTLTALHAAIARAEETRRHTEQVLNASYELVAHWNSGRFRRNSPPATRTED